MIKRVPVRWVGCLVCTFGVSSGLQAVEWEPSIEPYNQIFPALEISLANLEADPEDADPAIVGQQDGLIGVVVDDDDVKPGTRFELLVKIPGYASPSQLSGTIPTAAGPWQLNPLIAWDFDALAKLSQPKPGNAVFELKLNGGPVEIQTRRIRLRSVNDALYFLDEESDEDDVDLNWMFAAYVNEDHPMVDAILKEALATGIVDAFAGYQAEDQENVLQQVYAIWHVLQERGIRYSSITRTSNEHPNVHSQHVRFLDESLSMTQANCVDGSVLLASILRKIDIAPALVLIPGHMFLAFQLDAEGENYAFLETTMLGDVHDGQGQRLRQLRAGLNVAVDQQKSLASFAAAMDQGQSEYDEAGDAFADEADIEHQFIDIQTAREMGVMPITR